MIDINTDRLKRFDGHKIILTDELTVDESKAADCLFGRRRAYVRIWKSGMMFQSPTFYWDDREHMATTVKLQNWFDEVYQKVFGPPKPEPEEIVEYIPRKFEP